MTSLENGLEELNSVQSLKIKNDWICAVLEGYTRKPSLLIGKLPQRGSESKIEWIFTDEDDSLHQKANVQLVTLSPKVDDANYRKKCSKLLFLFIIYIYTNLANLKFESILVQAKNTNNSLIIFPHGNLKLIKYLIKY